MVQATTPDGIPKWTRTDPTSITAESQAQGDAIQAAFNKRERYSYVWPTSTERFAEAGMVQGSTGYQVDTRTEYIYDNSAWRLQLSHAEFTSSISTPNATLTLAGNFTLDASRTTNSTFVVPNTSGILLVADPGIYAVSSVTNNPLAMSSRAFLDLAYTSGAGDIQRVSINTGEDRGSLSSPNVRITVINQALYFQHFMSVSSPPQTVNTRVRITRLG